VFHTIGFIVRRSAVLGAAGRRAHDEVSRPAVSIEPFLPVSASTRQSARTGINRLVDHLGGSVELEWLD
jgi:hypothetical protein